MNAYEAYLTRDEAEHPYDNITTMLDDKRRKAEQLSNTLFSKIARSPRAMANAMVSKHVDYTADGYRVVFWRSSVLPYIQFDKYTDAVDATLTKLLEVTNE